MNSSEFLRHGRSQGERVHRQGGGWSGDHDVAAPRLSWGVASSLPRLSCAIGEGNEKSGAGGCRRRFFHWCGFNSRRVDFSEP